MGAAAMVARRIGEGQPERASSAAVQAIALGAIFVVFARPIVGLPATDPEVVALAADWAL